MKRIVFFTMTLLSMAQGAWSQGDGVEKTSFNFDPTAVNAVKSETSGIDDDGWYTLGGVKLNSEPTQEGVYINKKKKRLK